MDTLWKVPMSTRPSPALNRSTASASRSESASSVRPWFRTTEPRAVIRTGLGPPGRSKTAPPTAYSNAAMC
ncbi:hypothetical protein ABIB25_002465 [Nakamurella sp. UYEF19]